MSPAIKVVLCYCIAATCVFLTGCVTTETQPRMDIDLRSLADSYEKSNEIHKALIVWNAQKSQNSGNSELNDKISTLTKRMQTEAQMKYGQALVNLKKGEFREARRNLLLTLVADPGHKEALEQLQKRTFAVDYQPYETQEGDGPVTIARKVYGDPGKDFLVAYFADLDKKNPLKPGVTLYLPLLEDRAETRTKTKPENAQMSASKGPGQSKSGPKINKAEAERHYVNGIAYFLGDDFEKAIKEWVRALQLDPDHANAKRDLEKANRLLAKKGNAGRR